MAKAKIMSKTAGLDDRLKIVKILKRYVFPGIIIVVVGVTLTLILTREKKLNELETEFNAIQFEVGKWDLPANAKPVMDELVDFMQWHKRVNLKVEGHSSVDGDEAWNQKLSEKRAKSVVDYLIANGIDAEHLSYEGKGSSEPLDPNNPVKNRRTEFIIIE